MVLRACFKKNALCQGTTLLAAEKLVRAVGRDFSPGVNAAESTRALAPEGSQSEDSWHFLRHAPGIFSIVKLMAQVSKDASRQAYSQRRATLRAIRNSTIPTARRTPTCGQSSLTGRSRQNTLVKPSIAQALMVNRPAFCMAAGIKKRGNMLPPIDDIIRITSVDSAPRRPRAR